MSYYVPVNLLSTNNAKTVKGEKKNYKTAIMYLSPYRQNSKGINICSHASEGCVKSCLFNSGTARFEAVQRGKINKTEYFLADRVKFLNQLDKEITKFKNKYLNSEITPVIRLNGTSDILWERYKIRGNKNIFELHSDIQFYDYTKNYLRFDKELPSNYHLTFSMSETNHDIAIDLLKRGVNVSIVFEKTPIEYNGFKVVDGDQDDLRFLDNKGVIVGLKYKKATGKGGKEKNKLAFESGFVLRTNEIQNRIMTKVAMGE